MQNLKHRMTGRGVIAALICAAAGIVTVTISCAGVDCPGDLDGNGQVDLTDLSIMLQNFGTSTGANPEDGDLNGDGDVDLEDLAQLLSLFGVVCT